MKRNIGEKLKYSEWKKTTVEEIIKSVELLETFSRLKDISNILSLEIPILDNISKNIFDENR